MELSIIIPIYKTDGNAAVAIKTALSSIKNANGGDKYTVIAVGTVDVLENFNKIYKEINCPQQLRIVSCETEDYAEMINAGVMSCTTPYFSVIEVDDYYANYWFESVDAHINVTDDYSCIMPINEIIEEDGTSFTFANEIVWGASFNDDDKLGEVLLPSLKLYKEFQVAGAVIKTEDFISVGKLNPKMGILAWFEFLIKSVKSGKRIFVAPTVGYYHMLSRPNTLTNAMKENLKKEELDRIMSEIEKLL